MSFETRAEAVSARFKAQIETPQGVTVLYDNDPNDPPSDATWIFFSVLEGAGQQMSMGATKRFRYPGIAIAEISVPIGDGDAAAYALVDAIDAAFKAQTAGGITYRTPYPSRIGEADGWYKIAVTCPFYADEIS